MLRAALSIICLLLISLGHAAAEKRVALVIGNGSYAHQTPLQNARRDAQIVAHELQRIGFEVVGGGPLLDADKATIDNIIEAFRIKIQDSDIALFYFSGYGMQVAGKNY